MVVPSGLERWFLRAAEFTSADGRPCDRDSRVQSGDKYTWRWHGYSDEVNQSGEVVEANGSDRFAFTFSHDCLVTVSITNEAGENMVGITVSEIADDEDRNSYVNDSYGWTFYLANLKSVLEGGLDLRNRNSEIHDVVSS